MNFEITRRKNAVFAAQVVLDKPLAVVRCPRDTRAAASWPMARRMVVFGSAIAMVAAGCANPELDRLQALSDQARINMINTFLNPDPVTGFQPFLPNEQVTCSTFWGAFGEHQFLSDAKSCVEARHFHGMEPVDKAAHDQRMMNQSTRYVTALQNQARAAEAAQRAQQAEAVRRKAASLGNAQAGMQALGAGDSATAVRLFTEAIDGGGLSRPDQELALVKRGQAYLMLGNSDLARADLRQALQIDPSDREAAGLLSQ